MATEKQFQDMADRLFNVVFGDFKKTALLEQLGDSDYATQITPIVATDNTQGIRIEFDKSEFDGQKIQIGDFQIMILKQGLTVDVRADNVDLTFNGKPVNIINVSDDPANAAHLIQARDK